MAMRYSLICLLNLNFNFEDIEVILSKKESEILSYLRPITGEKISNLQNVISYFKEMQLIDDPISIDIVDKKYN